MDNRIKIIVMDDEEPMLRVLQKTLEPEGFSVEPFREPEAALRRIRDGGVDLVITDLMMPGTDGFHVLQEALGVDRDIIVIVITAFSTVESAVKAMKFGAYDFIPKPFDPEHLLLVVNRAVANKRLRLENIGLKRELQERDYLREMVGGSRPMLELKGLIDKVKDTDGTVLIQGESGVGKELVARAIHFGSKRKAGGFVPINCGAIPDNLLESELFGYEKGAFSGAVSQKKGLLEVAHCGTVFLDEVGSISPMMQVKLLRFLQDRSFMRLGGHEVIQVDVRVIAATNEDLKEAVDKGAFRKDLYYRLNVIPLEVPPLRRRKDDIPLLIRYFLDKYAKRTGKEIWGIEKEAEDLLTAHRWDGNVRELENTIERAVTLTGHDRVTVEDLPMAVRQQEADPDAEGGYPPHFSLLGVEQAHIRNVLDSAGGNKSEAARMLGIDYSTLLRKLKAMGL